MKTQLFQFIDIRGASEKSLTTKDIILNPDNNLDQDREVNLKGLSLDDDESKTGILNKNYLWISRAANQPILQTAHDAGVLTLDDLFNQVNPIGNVVLNDDDFTAAIRDYELLMLKKMCRSQDREPYDVVLRRRLKIVLVVNALTRRPEFIRQFPPDKAIRDIQLSVPKQWTERNLPDIATKYPEVTRNDLYGNNFELLKDLFNENGIPKIDIGDALKILQYDHSMLDNIMRKIRQALNTANMDQQWQEQRGTIANDKSLRKSKESLLSRAWATVFGRSSPALPGEVIDAKRPGWQVEINAGVAGLSDQETNLLQLIGVNLAGTNQKTIEQLERIQEFLADKIVSAKRKAKGSSPTRAKTEVTRKRPRVRNVGIGDLYTVEAKTIGYKPSEISFIQNVMARETRGNENKLLKEYETINEIETTEEEEQQRDLSSTNRFSLKSEAEKAIKEDFGLKAGVKISAKYGVAQIDASTDATYSRSTQQSQKSAFESASEIVNKAVERTKSVVRQLTRRTERTTIEEKNTHGFNNDTADHINGIYQFVDKIQEVSLLHYGKRLLLEFYIPEPAISLLQKNDTIEDPDNPNPGDFNIDADAITETNYMGFCQQFGIGDLPAPPPKWLTTGYTWRTAPDESQDRKPEDTGDGKIAIPSGYVPTRGSYSATSHRYDNSDSVFFFHLSVGGARIADVYLSSPSGTFNISGAVSQTEEGLPVTVRVHKHFDRTCVVNVQIESMRTTETLKAWKRQVFQKLKERHEVLMTEYKRRKDENRFFVQQQPVGRSPIENQEIIRRELKKWSIKALKGSALDYDATILESANLWETDPYEALRHQPHAWFYENNFEWDNMVFIFYPYFWGRRSEWISRMRITENDFLFQNFLQAGAAKVIVPVTPNMEKYVLKFISDPMVTEENLYDINLTEEDSPFGDLWVELIEEQLSNVSRGSGSLTVDMNSADVVINPDSTWIVSAEDVNRMIIIEGIEYQIISVEPVANMFTLDRGYEQVDKVDARYIIRGKLVGSPWRVRVPTALTYLTDEALSDINPTA